MLISRITTEILGPVPVGELALEARVARKGRSVELLEATLRAADRPVMMASAWRVLRTQLDSAGAGAGPAPPRCGPGCAGCSSQVSSRPDCSG